MFLGMPLPSWRQIARCKSKREQKTYYEELCKDVLFLAESCMSINLIIRAVKSVRNKDRITILVPDYFCGTTIKAFYEEWMDLVYYPIKEDMEPDWDFFKSDYKDKGFDVFLFTHYFGIYFNNVSRAKEICKNHDAILIEDCAHVIYPTGKMGSHGDFVIFSPHKQLPIMDGAVLMAGKDNQREYVTELYEWMRLEYSKICSNRGQAKWYLKKAIQKLFLVQRKVGYYSGIHYDDSEAELHLPAKISRESYNTLCDYSYKELKIIAQIRRDNLDLLNYIIAKKYKGVCPLIDSRVSVPYVAAFSLSKVSDKKKIAEDMINDGLTVLFWPDLPIAIKGVEGHNSAEVLSENIIVLPIHQDIKLQQIAKRLKLSKED